MEAVVEYNYEAQEPDELSIRKGDIIKDIKVSNGGWWEGTLRDKRGMFPDNFVKVLDPSGSARYKNDEVTLRNNAGRKVCRVLFSYEPCNDDELKLVVDDNIEYLGEVEEGWWRGRIKGRTGVFPSNFVAAPVPEEAERQHKEKKEFCKVLFPYEAANDDELTIAEGDIIALLSKDAPDKGWWKGELKGQIGLFPDNFVEVIALRSNDHQDGQANNHAAAAAAAATATGKSSLTKNQTGKKKETAVTRKSLDVRNNTRIDNPAKKTSATAALASLSANTGDKKTSNVLLSSLKRFVSDGASGAINGNGNGNAGTALGEELDEVERGEGAPLSHLTASRAKAPRRRLPSTHALKQQNSTGGGSSPTNNNGGGLKEENMTNGSSDILEMPVKDDENDGNAVAKSKQKPPWMEELKLNQMERRKVTDRPDKLEKKEKPLPWMSSSTHNADVTSKPSADLEESKLKDKAREKEREKAVRTTEPSPQSDHSASSPSSGNLPAFVPYHLYSQLLDRIAVLEEKQTVLQRKVDQLTDQLASAASDKD